MIKALVLKIHVHNLSDRHKNPICLNFTIFAKMAHNTFDKHNFSDKQIEDFRHAFEFFDKVSSYLIIDFAVETNI